MKKRYIAILILFLTVGYASIGTNLFLNSNLNIGFNNEDFDVHFESIMVDSTMNNSLISEEGKSFTVTGNLVEYSVVNNSSQYDVDVNLICSPSINEEDENTVSIEAQSSYRTRFNMPNSTTETTCQLNIKKIERTTIAEDRLKTAEMSDSVWLGKNIDRNSIESVTFKELRDIPSNTVELWDVSIKQNNSIMAYTVDDDNNGLYEAYIVSNGKIKGNTDSSFLFYKFTKLKSINNLENFVTKDIESFSRTFGYCSSLTNLDTNLIDVSNARDFYRMFDECHSLSVLDLKNWNTSNVTDMSLMFRYCINLTELDLNSWDTSKVTTMFAMFIMNDGNEETTSQLTTLKINNWNISNVTDMSLMFKNCINLTELDLNSWNTSKVKTMKEMFSMNDGNDGTISQLSNLKISNWDTSNVTNMGYMFRDCQNLTELDVSSFKTGKVTDMKYMFYNCGKLATIGVDNWDTSKVTSMAFMFWSCPNLVTLNVGNWNTGNVTAMNNMFCNDAKLTELNVANWNVSKVKNLQSIFWGLALTKIDVSKWNTSSVTNMVNVFYSCNNLVEADTSNWDTSNVTASRFMFRHCYKLKTSITIRGTKNTSYSGMFVGASTQSGAGITVNYTEDASTLVDKMIATKSSTSNVTKGTLVS